MHPYLSRLAEFAFAIAETCLSTASLGLLEDYFVRDLGPGRFAASKGFRFRGRLDALEFSPVDVTRILANKNARPGVWLDYVRSPKTHTYLSLLCALTQ